jgi:hypothetical protein
MPENEMLLFPHEEVAQCSRKQTNAQDPIFDSQVNGVAGIKKNDSHQVKYPPFYLVPHVDEICRKMVGSKETMDYSSGY